MATPLSWRSLAPRAVSDDARTPPAYIATAEAGVACSSSGAAGDAILDAFGRPLKVFVCYTTTTTTDDDDDHHDGSRTTRGDVVRCFTEYNLPAPSPSPVPSTVSDGEGFSSEGGGGGGSWNDEGKDDDNNNDNNRDNR